MPERQRWGSKLGVILAVAGSAVGLGNFLRFPVQAAQHGGGAFMIPYFISLVLLGIPLMWIEWAIGRYGGLFGHGTAPSVFQTLWQRNRFIKYFGVIGIFGPLVIFIYYTYIESWLLGYAVFAATGRYAAATTPSEMQTFLRGYQGLEQNHYFQGIGWAYGFFLITFAANLWIVSRGIAKGIEWLTRWALPLLFACAVILAARVLMLGAPDPARPDWHALNGLGFLWNPDFSVLSDATVWLAAAGQVFFTLSVGIGVILTYASYLKREQDVVLSGLTSVATNELAEVILGGSIVIPAAVAFFGPTQIGEIARSGAFNLGFVTMPLMFQRVAFGPWFTVLWFGLLFLAGLTSSISLLQPAIAFMEDEFHLSRRRAIAIMGTVAFLATHAAIFGLGRGVLDEMDFWGGTFALVLFGTIEVILFTWVFGMDRAWEELHRGAELDIPPVFRVIMKYVTPAFLLVILGAWLWQQGLPVILLAGAPPDRLPAILATRLGLTVLFGLLAYLVHKAWRSRKPYEALP
ncbi:MAG: sodium-dependent transporter [Candidatus Omnitrophica bacterium]|nr:sodium-dependent transporter [Candidatus Omnitrophota bacterium]